MLCGKKYSAHGGFNHLMGCGPSWASADTFSGEEACVGTPRNTRATTNLIRLEVSQDFRDSPEKRPTRAI